MRASIGLWASALLLVTTTISAASSPFTPEKLIAAPRPSAEFSLSLDGANFLLPVSYSHIDGRPTTSEVQVYHVAKGARDADNVDYANLQDKDGDRRAGKTAVISGISWATWLDDDHVVFVNESALYSAPLADLSKSHKIASLPAPISEDSLKVVPTSKDSEKRLLFVAEVYEDGELEGVAKVETPEHEDEWNRLKVYDGNNGAFFRHWNTWVRTGKYSQIFSITLSASNVKGDESVWTMKGSEFTNLLKGTKINTPIGPFGGNDDWDVDENGLVLITKALDLPEAWHTKSDVYYVSFSSGKVEKITRGDHGAVSAPTLSPDGQTIAWLQMGKDGFESDKKVLHLHNLKTGEQQSLLKTWDRSPAGISFSPNGRKIFLKTEDHQREKIYHFELGPDASSIVAPQELETIKTGSIANFVPLSDSVALFTASSLRSLNEVYLYHYYNKAAYPLTWNTGSALKDIAWGDEPTMFHYPSPDREGENRWGWLHYPSGYGQDKKEKWPLLVLIHGGPEAAWTDSWSTRWNPEVFCQAGYLVVTLNPTGSSGFGQLYQDRIIDNWGGEPYRDILAGVHHILKTEKAHLDPERVAAAGASYGGYSINWLQGHNDAKLFKALVCHDGVFNTKNTFYATDELYFPESEFGGGTPWNLSARSIYDKWSPEGHVSSWNTPQLIIHGGRDYRLTPTEGISAFNVLRRRGIDSRLLYFDDEGHHVLNPRNSLRWHQEILGWVEKYIGKGAKKQEAEQMMVEGGSEGLVFQS